MNCKGKTTSGAACKMPALKNGRFCFTHDPATRAAQAQARKLGGHRSATPHAGNPETIPAQIVNVQDARALLAYVMAELLIADNSIQRNRALIALHDSFIKSLEIGELEARIQALEALRK
jgi:hypothetical protein